MLHNFQFRTKLHCTVHTNNRANYFEIFTKYQYKVRSYLKIRLLK